MMTQAFAWKGRFAWRWRVERSCSVHGVSYAPAVIEGRCLTRWGVRRVTRRVLAAPHLDGRYEIAPYKPKNPVRRLEAAA